MKEIANFFFEMNMLKKTPRSGFQFLGSGHESVAEHISQTMFIGYVLCKLEAGADENKVMKMCLFHDLPEARTGDMNYVNKKYVTVDEKKAIDDLTENLFFGGEVRDTLDEFNGGKTREARLAHDADQLALLIQLKESDDLGNKYSQDWIAFVLKRLCTEAGKQMARSILETDSTDWWFTDKGDWWISANKTSP
jgi:putative hydrolase of HD superfamily